MIHTFKQYLQSKIHLDEILFEQMAIHAQVKTFHKGSIILNEGEVCQYNFFIAKGLLKSYIIDSKGKEHIIQFAPENWFLSDRDGVLENKPSKMYFEAVEESTCVLLKIDFFTEMSNNSQEFNQLNSKLLHNNIRFLQKRIIQQLSASAEERYLAFIEMYPNLLQRVSLQDIAAYLGITPESLSRLRKDLVKKL